MADRVKQWNPNDTVILPQAPYKELPLELKTPTGIPEGYTQLDKYTRVYVSDKWLLITGTPDESEDEETSHNCDAMGCGWEHVLYRFPLKAVHQQYAEGLPEEGGGDEEEGGMRYVSIFTGIDAASLAWMPLNWEPVAFAEIEPFPCAVLAHHYPHVPNLGDVSNVDWRPYRGVDVVVGGSPCQAFSVAGLRQSLSDPRGNLTLEYVRAVHAIRPRYAVWENVPGVLSTSDNAFGCFLAALVGADEALAPEESWPGAGMVSGPEGRAAWRILDAQYFGVAQRRRRVFLVFCPGDGADPGEILFERPRLLGHPPARGERGKQLPEALRRALEAVAGSEQTSTARGGLQPVEVSPTLRAGGNRTGGDRPPGTDVDTADSLVVTHALRADGFDASEDGTGRGTPLVPVANTLKANNGGGGFGSDPNETFIPCAIPIQDTGKRTGASTDDPRAGIWIGIGNEGDPKPGQGYPAVVGFYGNDSGNDAAEELCPTLRAMPGGGGNHPAVAFTVSEQSNGFAWLSDTVPTLQAHPQSDTSYIQKGILQNVGVRRLTPRECERLQGFPDGYTDVPYRGKPAADGPRYKAIGNSMAVPVMRWIGERIKTVHAEYVEGATVTSESEAI